MKLRDLVAGVRLPYRKVVYVLVSAASLLLWLPFWLPPRWYFIRYVALSIAMAGLLYIAFWVYRGGYRKEGLLMAIGYTAFFAICIVVLIYAQPVVSGG